MQDSLDLGHDDLQRTLQQQSNAARSSNNGHVPSPHSVDLNPMEFIEQNHGAGGGGSGGSTGNPNAGPTGIYNLNFLRVDFKSFILVIHNSILYLIIGNNGSSSHLPPTAPFELDFDKFDMLTEFPELDQHYHSQNNSGNSTSGGNQSGGNNSGMIHHGTSGPLLSSTMTATTPPGGGSKRHHIAEYSPDWAWSDVSVLPIIIHMYHLFS